MGGGEARPMLGQLLWGILWLPWKPPQVPAFAQPVLCSEEPLSWEGVESCGCNLERWGELFKVNPGGFQDPTPVSLCFLPTGESWQARCWTSTRSSQRPAGLGSVCGRAPSKNFKVRFPFSLSCQSFAVLNASPSRWGSHWSCCTPALCC